MGWGESRLGPLAHVAPDGAWVPLREQIDPVLGASTSSRQVLVAAHTAKPVVDGDDELTISTEIVERQCGILGCRRGRVQDPPLARRHRSVMGCGIQVFGKH